MCRILNYCNCIKHIILDILDNFLFVNMLISSLGCKVNNVSTNPLRCEVFESIDKICYHL